MFIACSGPKMLSLQSSVGCDIKAFSVKPAILVSKDANYVSIFYIFILLFSCVFDMI